MYSDVLMSLLAVSQLNLISLDHSRYDILGVFSVIQVKGQNICHSGLLMVCNTTEYTDIYIYVTVTMCVHVYVCTCYIHYDYPA